jgi:hypothetical protein
MTRRDFILIADVIAANTSVFTNNTAHAAFAADMARALTSTNPRFNASRFVEACRPSWVVGTRHEAAWDRVAARAVTS